MNRKRRALGTEVTVEHERAGLQGRDCIKVTFPDFGGLKLRMPFEDAESLGEALVECVRKAECGD